MRDDKRISYLEGRSGTFRKIEHNAENRGNAALDSHLFRLGLENKAVVDITCLVARGHPNMPKSMVGFPAQVFSAATVDTVANVGRWPQRSSPRRSKVTLAVGIEQEESR